MDALNSDIPRMQLQLTEYENEITSIINDSKTLPLFEDWISQLQRRLADIKTAQEELKTFSNVHKKYAETPILTNLAREHKEVSELLFTGLFLIFLIIILVAFIAALISLYKKYISDHRGLMEVEEIQRDFERLLFFIEKNGYSFNVNLRAIAYLERIAPKDYDSLNRISKVAWKRHNKLGEKNDKIARSLDEVVTGIDTILNHRLPG